MYWFCDFVVEIWLEIFCGILWLELLILLLFCVEFGVFFVVFVSLLMYVVIKR